MDTHEITMLRKATRELLARQTAQYGQALAEAGFFNVLDSEDAGGFTAFAVVAEEISLAGADLPYVERVAARQARSVCDTEESALLVVEVGRADGVAQPPSIESGSINGSASAVRVDTGATRLVIVDCDTLASCSTTAKGLRLEARSALGGITLYDVHFDNVRAEGKVVQDGAAAEAVRVAYTIGLCARQIGATRRLLQCAVEHAKNRRQFGQLIGSFQAIQHKLADCAIVVEAAAAQLYRATEACDRAEQGAALALLSCSAFCAAALRRAALESLHALGAIGHAEEHEASALFRRVHIDATALGGVRAARAAIAARLLDGADDAFAQTGDDARAAAFRQEFRAWLDTAWSAEERAHVHSSAVSFADRPWNLDFARRLGAAGYTTLTWPRAHGGQERTPLEQLAYVEEILRADAPDLATLVASWIVGPELITHGNPQLQAELLPAIRRGAASFCLGYSEPEAGSDLASLRTRARRDGESYVIDGQKIWTTDGQRASHMILAARTDPDAASRQRGISLFLLPMNTPGISVRPSMALYGYPFCNVFLDNVRIGVHARLGEENAGWPILGSALAAERIMMGGYVARVRRLLERIVATLRADRSCIDADVRQRIGGWFAEVESARQLALRAVSANGGDANAQMVAAAMSKVYSSALGERLAEGALELFGAVALLGDDAPGVPADGLIDQLLRRSIMMVIGGGTNEIQRTLIARRGLGLPS